MKTKLLLFITLICVMILSASGQSIRSPRNIGLGEIIVIELADNGDAWVGSDSGAAFYNHNTSGWTYFNTTNTNGQMKSDTVTSFSFTPIGGANFSFIGTTNGILVDSAGTLDSMQHLLDPHIKGLVYRPDSLWVVTPMGMTRFDSTRTTQQTHLAPFTPVTCTQIKGLNCGGFWSGTANNGCFYTVNGTSFTYIDTSMPHQKLVDNRVNALTIDPQCNQKFIGTKGGFSICPTGIPCHNFTVDSGLPENDVTVVEQDCLGRIWIGTRDSGLVVWDNPGFTRITTVNGLASNKITYISFNHSCTGWIGTADGKISVVDSNKTVVGTISMVENLENETFDVKVFPQPSNNQVTFLFDKEVAKGDFFLTDITGRNLQHAELKNATKTVVDVSILSTGIYLYQLYDSQRLMKAGKVQVVK